MEEERSHGPGVLIPPPLLYLLPLAAGLIVQRVVPIHIVSGDGPAKILDVVGAAEIFIGVSLAAWAAATFRRLQTPILPIRPARTRGRGAVHDHAQPDVPRARDRLPRGHVRGKRVLAATVLPEALVFTYLFAIKREERYLAREFGDAYTEYCARVRRWI